MAQNAADLCLVSLVEGDLGLSAGSAVAQAALTAVSKRIARYCGRTFERSSAVTEYPPSHGRHYLQIRRPPVVSITSITEFGATVDSAEYECVGDDVEAGLIKRKRAYGNWSSLAREDGLISATRGSADGESGSSGYTVVYAGGYVTPGQNALDAVTYPTVTLPEDLQHAARVWSASFKGLLGVDLRVASETLGNWSVVYAGVNDLIGRSSMPSEVKEIVDAYRLPFVMAAV